MQAVNGTNNHSVAAMLRDADNLGDSILLIVALCFHSVFEGIAIGVAGNLLLLYLTILFAPA